MTIERLETRTHLSATPLATIPATELGHATTLAHTAVRWNGETYFAVNRTAVGSSGTSRGPVELWKSGGTVGTTTLVKDLGSAATSAIDVSNFTVVGSKLFFTLAPNGTTELWVSDGTAAGTQSIKSLAVSTLAPDLQLTSFNGRLYFAISQAADSSGYGLWTSDGTLAGTTRVVQTNVANLTSAGGALYFYGTGGLWKSNGLSGGGTSLLKSLSSATLATADPNHAAFCEMDGAVYFVGRDTSNSNGLFKTDGTTSGTIKLMSFVSNSLTNPYFTPAGHTMYFVAGVTSSSAQLCKSDGTAAGSVTIATTPTNSSPANLVALGNRVLFSATGSGIGSELWITDGTAAGSTLLKDISAGSASSSPSELINDGNGSVYFEAAAPDAGSELWKTGGTPNGTVRVTDLYAGTNGSAPRELLADGAGSVFFQAVDPTAGYSMFVIDGASGGTTLLKDYSDAPLNPTLSRAVTDDGRIFFVAGDATSTGRELYVTDASGAVASLVADIGPAANPDTLVAIGNTVYFAATTTNNGRELWKSDGTAAGTVLVKDIASNSAGRDSSNPRAFYNFNGTLYFTAQDTGSSSFLLWKSDGTPAGTVKVTTSSGATISGPNSQIGYVVLNGSLYLDTGTKIDGTTGVATTSAIVAAFSGFSSIANMRAVYGALWFSGAMSGEGAELWRFDGVNAAVRVADIRPGASSSNPNAFTAFKGHVYFTADDGINGRELWSTDGTAAGTSLVKDIYSGGFGSANPSMLTPLDDQLIFFGFDPDHGTGLWRTDGTTAGTQFVKDMRPGSDQSLFSVIGSVGGRVYFTADDGSGAGVELWTTDGTAAGTQMVEDLAPGAASSNPLNLLDVNGSLLFTANTASGAGPSFFSLADTVAPRILSTTFTITTTKHAVSVQFSEDVSATLDVSDFTVRENKSGAVVPAASIGMTYEVGSNIAILTFPGYANGLLPNGGYTVSLVAGAAADPAGHLLVNGTQRSFIVYANTASGTRTVRVQLNADGQDVQVFVSNVSSSSPAYTVPAGTLDTMLYVTNQAWPDTFTVEMQNGNPLRGATVQLSGNLFSQDIIAINGSSAAESFSFASGSIDLPDAGRINYVNVSPPALRFNGRGGGDTLDVRGGNEVELYGPQQFAALTIASEMSVSVNFNETSTITVGALSIDPLNAHLDLADWDAIVTNTPQSTIESYVRDGRFLSYADFEENTALGVMSGADYLNNNGSDHFDGIAINPTDVLVKYTYFGDVDFNGVVDVSDYNLIDFGFSNHLTGWANGDADYSGGVDVSDYNLIDFAFTTQTAAL